MKRLRIVSLILAALVLCTGCSLFSDGDEPKMSRDPNYPFMINDARIWTYPTTVVSLSPALTETIIELGLGDMLGGVSNDCSYRGETLELPACGTVRHPDLENIRQVNPEYLIISAALVEEDLIELQQMNIEIIVLPRAETLEELYETYLLLFMLGQGRMTGYINGTQYNNELQERVAYLEETISNSLAESRLSGAYVAMLPLTVATDGSFEAELLEILQLDNETGAGDGDYLINEEDIPEFYPDVLFYNSAYITEEEITGSALYSNTPAEAAGAVYGVDGSVFERQTPRLFALLEEIAGMVYPELFPENHAGGNSTEPEDSASRDDITDPDASMPEADSENP